MYRAKNHSEPIIHLTGNSKFSESFKLSLSPFWAVSSIPMKNANIYNFYSSPTINNEKLIWYFRSPLYDLNSHFKNLDTLSTSSTLGKPHKPKHTLSTLSYKHAWFHASLTNLYRQKIITQNPEFSWQGIPSFQRVPRYHYGLYRTVSSIPMKNPNIWNFRCSLTTNNETLIWYFRNPCYAIVSNMTHFLILFGMREKNGLFLNCVSPVLMQKSKIIWNFHSSLALNNGKLVWYFKSPWYAIVTLYNVCAVPWGVAQYRGGCSVPWGDIMSTMGGYHEYHGGISWVPWRDILSTMGVFGTVGDIMINKGDILSTVGVFSTVGDIMSTVGCYLEYRGGCSVPWGDIMMHVGGYHEYRGGCSVPWGDIILWNLSTVGDIMIHVGGYHEYRGGVQYCGVLK